MSASSTVIGAVQLPVSERSRPMPIGPTAASRYPADWAKADSEAAAAGCGDLAAGKKIARASAATNPAAQLAHIADAVDRLNKINAAPETTGSIAPMTTPPAEPKIVDRIVEDWVVQDVHGDRALVEGRNGSLFEVGAGSILPGVGRVEAVKRQDGQWVVVTARGVITSGR